MLRGLFASALVVAAAGTTAPTAGAHEGAKSATQVEAYLRKLKGWFDPDMIVAGPTAVDCKLSGGAETKCVSITLKLKPVNLKAGPWCPRHVSDGPEKSGIWIDRGKVYDADGAFIKNLATFYRDTGWRLFDPKTGKINVTDTRAACLGAAKPDVDPKYYNYCVECQLSYMKPDASATFAIPIVSVAATGRRPRIGLEGVGVSFSGVKLDAAAPLDAILGAHTLAPFDDCGGHVNPHAGYHIHAATDCLRKIDRVKGHASMIGIALDGHLIYAHRNPDGKVPSGLDSCGGHTSGKLGYHYHASAPGENRIIGCHTGQHGCYQTVAGRYCDATRRPPPP